ncbi:MAG: cellulase family glycosylhydrolase [Oscillospiraceae bacterium]|nr:cellulase family glycosylhydrolase [Oscillospiraceae bacterium]
MRLKRITALFLAVLTCIFTLTAGVSAAEKKGIKLDKTKVTVAVGETCTLKPSLVGYKKATVQWSSSDKSVATVKKGVVTAKKEGTAKITVKIKDTNYKATCTVTVTKKSSGNAGSNNYKNANEFVSKLKVGWNLGNALDATGGSGVSSETSWGNVKTTKELINAVKKAGFNTVRIPVSWGKHIDSNGKIDEAWLDRVQEVVDYAYDNNMYVILNVHHDNNAFPLDDKNEAAVTKKYKNLWKQIAARFKDYDEKLIFEGRNEPRTEGSAKEWTGGTKAEWEVMNRMYKVFVDTVRESGGNNKTRFLMVAPYAATSTSYQAMTALEIPDDRTIVEVHVYNPNNLALNGNLSYNTFDADGQKELDWVFDNINKAYISKGIPVIIDECGYTNKGNTDERIKAYKYMITTAKKYGMPCVIWDNGATGEGNEKFGFINRTTCEWYFPELIKAIVDAAK